MDKNQVVGGKTVLAENSGMGKFLSFQSTTNNKEKPIKYIVLLCYRRELTSWLEETNFFF